MSGFPQWDKAFLNNKTEPKWALPKNSRTNKLHCFVDKVSLCNCHVDYKTDSIEESGIVYERPNTVCQKCLIKWKRQYNTEV